MLKKGEDEIEGKWMGGGRKMQSIIPKLWILSFPKSKLQIEPQST